MEARNVQSRIEESTGAQLKFNLKPGDSVFQTFDDFEDESNDNIRRRQRRRRSQDNQLLSVSAKTTATKNTENQGLKAVADYLQNRADIEENISYSPNRKGKLKRCKSDILFTSTTQTLNSSIFSEYKEYLKSITKIRPTPSFRKLLPAKAMVSSENNPIIVVTNHK